MDNANIAQALDYQGLSALLGALEEERDRRLAELVLRSKQHAGKVEEEQVVEVLKVPRSLLLECGLLPVALSPARAYPVTDLITALRRRLNHGGEVA